MFQCVIVLKMKYAAPPMIARKSKMSSALTIRSFFVRNWSPESLSFAPTFKANQYSKFPKRWGAMSPARRERQQRPLTAAQVLTVRPSPGLNSKAHRTQTVVQASDFIVGRSASDTNSWSLWHKRKDLSALVTYQ